MTLSRPFHERSILILLLCFYLWSRIPLPTHGATTKATSDTEIKVKATLQSNPALNPLPDAITAATTDIELELIEMFDNLKGVVGLEMDIRFFASEFIIASYTLSGNLPPGLRLSSEVNHFGVGGIQGIPTQEGLYLANVTGWEEPGAQGNPSIPLSILFEIVSKGPTITEQPSNTIVDWGQAGSMQVIVDNLEGVSFQWFKDLVEIEGETGPTLSYPHASYKHNGTYRVEAIGPEGKSFSQDAFFFVRATPYQRYLENTYEEPFIPELSNTEDLDKDGFQNQIEVALGSDLADPLDKPTYQLELLVEGNQPIAFLTHSVSNSLVNSQIQVEVSGDLSPESWEKLNVPPEEVENLRIYSWNSAGRQFIRITIVD